MISVEIRPTPDGSPAEEVEIHLDAAGLASLLAQLTFLREGRTDHVHLFSTTWGGSDLKEDPVDPANGSVRHLKILRCDGAPLE